MHLCMYARTWLLTWPWLDVDKKRTATVHPSDSKTVAWTAGCLSPGCRELTSWWKKRGKKRGWDVEERRRRWAGETDTKKSERIRRGKDFHTFVILLSSATQCHVLHSSCECDRGCKTLTGDQVAKQII